MTILYIEYIYVGYSDIWPIIVDISGLNPNDQEAYWNWRRYLALINLGVR